MNFSAPMAQAFLTPRIVLLSSDTRDDEVIAQGTAERADNISYFFWHCSSLPYEAAGVLQYLDCAHDAFVRGDLDIDRESLETGFAG